MPAAQRLTLTDKKKGKRQGVLLRGKTFWLAPRELEFITKAVNAADPNSPAQVADTLTGYSAPSLKSIVSRTRSEFDDPAVIITDNGKFRIGLEPAEIDFESFRQQGFSRPVLTEVYICLGKCLRENRLTIEGFQRINKLTETVFDNREEGIYPVVIFCGHKGDQALSEAEVFHHYFSDSLLKLGLSWDGDVIVEPDSPFTYDNLSNAIRAFQAKHSTSANSDGANESVVVHVTRVYIVSSDYHLSRLVMEDRWLPEISILRKLRQEFMADIVPIGASYLFKTDGFIQHRWLARGYLALHKLSLLQGNLIGIVGSVPDKKTGSRSIPRGRIREIRPKALETLKEAIGVMEEMLDEIPVEGAHRQKVEQSAELLSDSLSEARDLFGVLTPYLGQQIEDFTARFWESCLKQMNEGVLRYTDRLRTFWLDPDSVL